MLPSLKEATREEHVKAAAREEHVKGAAREEDVIGVAREGHVKRHGAPSHRVHKIVDCFLLRKAFLGRMRAKPMA